MKAEKRAAKPTWPSTVIGTIKLSRLPDGTALARVQEISQMLTVREAAQIARCGRDLIRARVEDGTLAHRWKNHIGERGTILVEAESLQQWLRGLVTRDDNGHGL
jgi:hypothetical protein